jgi:hypothetical protein
MARKIQDIIMGLKTQPAVKNINYKNIWINFSHNEQMSTPESFYEISTSRKEEPIKETSGLLY